jgi:DNA-directed RNA polymerase III subunit RPC1
MSRLAKLTTRFLKDHGFSIGIGINLLINKIDDVIPSELIDSKKKEIMKKSFETCELILDKFKNNKLEPDAGCTTEQTVEAKLNNELSAIRSNSGKICMDNLNWYKKII